MASIRGIKTVVATAAAIFAGTSVKTGRTFMRVRNMDPVLSVVIGGRTLEPGELINFDFVATNAETVLGYSNGRAVEIEVIEA